MVASSLHSQIQPSPVVASPEPGTRGRPRDNTPGGARGRSIQLDVDGPCVAMASLLPHSPTQKSPCGAVEWRRCMPEGWGRIRVPGGRRTRGRGVGTWRRRCRRDLDFNGRWPWNPVVEPRFVAGCDGRAGGTRNPLDGGTRGFYSTCAPARGPMVPLCWSMLPAPAPASRRWPVAPAVAIGRRTGRGGRIA